MDAAVENAADRVVGRLKAVADEKRLRIMCLLAGGERCVCELQDELGAGQSLLSFHLRTLKDAGLVTDRREGRWVYYALDRKALEELEAFVGELRAGGGPDIGPSRPPDRE